jgi:hypothetical protein
MAHAILEVDRLFDGKLLKNGEKSDILSMAMAEILLLYCTYEGLRHHTSLAL